MGSRGQGWHNGGGDDDFDNVVRLPTEWIGPPEELVPIGRAADRTLSADSFWGADSQALHEAVRPARAGVGSSSSFAAPLVPREESDPPCEDTDPLCEVGDPPREDTDPPREDTQSITWRRQLALSSLACLALMAAGVLVVLLTGGRAGVGSTVASDGALTTAGQTASTISTGVHGRAEDLRHHTAGRGAVASRLHSRSGVLGGRRGARRSTDASSTGATGSHAGGTRPRPASTIGSAGVNVSASSGTTTSATQSTPGSSEKTAGAVGSVRSGVRTAESSSSVAGLPAPGGPPAP